MTDFFASLYEWFGIMPLYSKGMMERLRGWDITCTGYIASPLYNYIGWSMIIVTAFIYALQYHIIDSSRWNKKQHWWLFSLVIVSLNFIIAFSLTYNMVQSGDFCQSDNLSVADCIGFSFSNALLSFILFVLLTSFPFPRRYIPTVNGGNCRGTTLWKP
jgi:hypothetical protein